MSEKLSSAAVMISALGVNPCFKIMHYALFQCLPSIYFVQRFSENSVDLDKVPQQGR